MRNVLHRLVGWTLLTIAALAALYGCASAPCNCPNQPAPVCEQQLSECEADLSECIDMSKELLKESY